MLVYYSSASGNTHRFVSQLEWPALRIPVEVEASLQEPTLPYVLICPTYADGEGRGAVPKQVIRFLNDPQRRGLLVGVIGSGNRNFGATYALAGRIISQKCNVPQLYSFELAGTQTDIARVRAGLVTLGEELCSTAI
ncbi:MULTISPECIES: class Ib ribonucleoside-diphosphate reductase assembly flavoprotein NrdI [Shimia]|uniref:class Ib ribonucleoside-diphosphate reductase assembly flavoprotein NrdI n=1 Tax=Shimia TaxID=573139 RepID=UPI001FB455D9|nr:MULTISPECIES: class Ib ribonucleoside-diphosphate reductase assembly flavoprotein NrdI [Shimia]MDV4146135.1 class Ib ribonucleoside-diphosphate reductase assembly flavoprotein NrdI [Shimia sp. FJ5]